MLPFRRWLCFSLGRPSSFPESELRVPLPEEQKLLRSLVTLSRLMSKCATRIYKQHHQSLAPIWEAANEILRELQRFAEQQRCDLNFGLVGNPGTGEGGLCQIKCQPVRHIAAHYLAAGVIKANNGPGAVYHHTLILTFRPFLVLRAKLRHEDFSTESTSNLPSPPPWLDTACEYCLDATRHSLSFLEGACEQNVLCRVSIP
jgi:hypothetical protein